MSIIDSLGTMFLKQRLVAIKSWIHVPQKTQQDILRKIINTAKNTQWGILYGYKNIQSYKDFSTKVPVSSYEDISKYIEQMMEGKSDILWPGLITHFAKSSGTTNARSKYIPVSKESFQHNHFNAGKDMIGLYLYGKNKTQLFSGKHIAVGGSSSYIDKEKKIVTGDISGLLIRSLPLWAKYIHSSPQDIALLSDWREKSDRIATETINKNITSLSGVPTWTVHLLKKILEKGEGKDIKEIWPNLEVFFHGGVSFTPYRKLFTELFGDLKVSFVEIYNASEGFFAIQDEVSKPGEMLLLLDHGIFYEFIPLHEIENLFPSAFTAEDVSIGESYALCITTESGLARYLIGDTVMVTSKNPIRIKILGRTKQFINTFGEELMVGNAEEAITRACISTGALVSDFTAGPFFMTPDGKGGHEWIVEFSKQPKDIVLFTKVLDETLREVNSDYDAKRAHDMALQIPIIHNVPSGTFYQWMESRNKLGGQHKVPRLSNTREYLESILSMKIK